MWPLAVVLLDEGVEARLLLQRSDSTAAALTTPFARRYAVRRRRRDRSRGVPTSAVVLLHSTTVDGGSLRMTAVGSESLVGLSLVLGFTRAPCRAVVHVDGHALRVDARSFSRALREHDFNAAVSRCVRELMIQLVQSTSCGRFHSPEQRLSRCLLETAHRTDTRTLALTHKVLAMLVGTRRP